VFFAHGGVVMGTWIAVAVGSLVGMLVL
jgi:hypothetical protein